MSAELIGLLSVGIGLGGLVLALQSRTDRRMDSFAAELAGLRGESRALCERVARLEGLIEGYGLFRPAEPANAAGA